MTTADLMKNRRQAWTLFLLLILYLGGTLGVFTGYYTLHHRFSFQHQVRKSDRNELEKLVFTEKEYRSIQWTEAGSEFEWQGKMYDVAEISISHEGYTIICENDFFEEWLISFLDAGKGKMPQGIKKGSPQPLCFNAGNFVIQPAKLVPVESFFPALLSLYNSIMPEISSPPPQQSIS